MKRPLVALAAVAALVMGAAPASGMFVIGHGGYHRQGIAKDSVNSQVQAYRHGMNCAETDIRLTSDHKIVQMHDAKVDRSTDGTGFVSEMTFKQVHALTLSDGQHPPSLVRGMRAAMHHGHKCMLVEAKDTDWTPDDFAYIQERAVHFGLVKSFRLYISRTSFLEMADANAPRIKAVWKCLRSTDAAEVHRLGAEGIVPRWGRMFRPFIRSMHAVNVKVYAGTNAEGADRWQHLLDVNADGLLTNDPRAVRWFNRHDKSSMPLNEADRE